jgi:hypothetical protein
MHYCFSCKFAVMGSVLQLVPATRMGIKSPGGASKSERHFLDFVIDGESLWEKVGKPRDSVSVICFEYSQALLTSSSWGKSPARVHDGPAHCVILSEASRRFLRGNRAVSNSASGRAVEGSLFNRSTNSRMSTRPYSHEETVKAVNRLLLKEKAVIPGDRRSLFICSECGDIGCGAVTAFLVSDGESIIWKDFGYENNYEVNLRLGEYKQIGPYTFDWKQYESALLQAIDDLKQPHIHSSA